MTRQYPRLDRWAARSQERFDRQRLAGGKREPETRGQRTVAATMAVIGQMAKAVGWVLMVVAIIGLVLDGTWRSLLLAFALLILLALSAYISVYIITARRTENRHWLTGLAPREQPPL